MLRKNPHAMAVPGTRRYQAMLTRQRRRDSETRPDTAVSKGACTSVGRWQIQYVDPDDTPRRKN